MEIDVEIIVSFVSFAALVLVWAVAPTKAAHETKTEAVPVAVAREALA